MKIFTIYSQDYKNSSIIIAKVKFWKLSGKENMLKGFFNQIGLTAAWQGLRMAITIKIILKLEFLGESGCLVEPRKTTLFWADWLLENFSFQLLETGIKVGSIPRNFFILLFRFYSCICFNFKRRKEKKIRGFSKILSPTNSFRVSNHFFSDILQKWP